MREKKEKKRWMEIEIICTPFTVSYIFSFKLTKLLTQWIGASAHYSANEINKMKTALSLWWETKPLILPFFILIFRWS